MHARNITISIPVMIGIRSSRIQIILPHPHSTTVNRSTVRVFRPSGILSLYFRNDNFLIMNTYTPKTFNLPTLEGLSEKQIKVHIGLYEGYIKHVNLIAEKLSAVRNSELELDPYIIAELRRRFAFEFDGMRMHEYYFDQLENGAQTLSPDSALAKSATEKYGSGEALIEHIKEVAGTRGIGWVVVYYDTVLKTLHTTFVADHEVGQLSGLPIILAMDMWEHAFMVDYVPADKKNYVEAFLKNVNWSVIEKRFEEVQ